MKHTTKKKHFLLFSLNYYMFQNLVQPTSSHMCHESFCSLLQMWRTMYESHQAQFHISQLLNHLTDDQKMELSTPYHRQAAVQLEAEVIRWYNSFCQVASSQLNYVRTLSKWIKLTDCLKDEDRQSLHSSAVRSLCDKWLFALERLPDKVLLIIS